MTRQTLTDGTGRWFDIADAKAFEEHTWFDGCNWISQTTGAQFDHQELYRTAGGRWVRKCWSQWQGSTESWEEIDDADAARWLSINHHDSHPACETEFAALEIA